MISFLTFPSIDPKVKELLLQKCLQRELPSLLWRFISYLTSKNRLDELAEIAQQYKHLAAHQLGIVEAPRHHRCASDIASSQLSD